MGERVGEAGFGGCLPGSAATRDDAPGGGVFGACVARGRQAGGGEVSLPVGLRLGGRLRGPASEGSCVEVGAWRSVSEFSNPLRPLPLLGPPPWGGGQEWEGNSQWSLRAASYWASYCLAPLLLRAPPLRFFLPAAAGCPSSAASRSPSSMALLKSIAHVDGPRRSRRSSPRRWRACPLPAACWCCALSVPARTHTQRESTGEKTRLVA